MHTAKLSSLKIETNPEYISSHTLAVQSHAWWLNDCTDNECWCSVLIILATSLMDLKRLQFHVFAHRALWLSLRVERINYSICKPALTVNIFTCCFTFQTPGLVRQITDQWSQTFRCKIVGWTNKKEDCQPHMSHQTRRVWNLTQQVKSLRLTLACKWWYYQNAVVTPSYWQNE